jgi:hypothetical protein
MNKQEHVLEQVVGLGPVDENTECHASYKASITPEEPR